MKHELEVKSAALHQFIEVQHLVEDDLGMGLSEMDETLSIHRDFLFM
jgi:hypothetical protein